ncbi:MAG: class I SAM-dependent methyltransferase [Chitinophagales bacterium]|nr:class I SAM-dependent methyltransferase [Chitinophagales bacterium]
MKKKEIEIKTVKNPWPTKAAMEQIYAMKLWGDNKTDFYSGIGSHNSELKSPYINSLVSFLTSFNVPPVVCDLGCGDFNVGKDLVKYTQRYIAIDIVTDLIAFNKKKFKDEQLEFHCMDIALDKLPKGDVAIIRQVLQHLSNTEVLAVVEKLMEYKYIILTEHLPEGDFEANKEIISGQGTRLKKQSGLNLLLPPFNLKVKEKTQLLSLASKHYPGLIVTILYEMHS